MAIAQGESPASLSVLSATAEAVLAAKVRLWVSGTVRTEPLETGLQQRPFAVWHLSSLTYDVGLEDCPPQGYTGTRELPIESAYSPSMFTDDLGCVREDIW